MDIHPILVHFPIALLTVYGLMELIWSKRLREEKSWFYVKASFLILGVLGAFASLSSGDAAAHLFADKSLSHLIEVHELWANIATKTFMVLGIAYVLHFISFTYKKLFVKTRYIKAWTFLLKVKDLILFSPLKYLIVLFGLVAITFTGALGGALVYGPDADIFISIVYSLLV